MRYFTKHDRENIIKICTIEGTLKLMIEEMADHHRPKEWLKALRTGHTWICKANQMMADQCSDDELRKLWKYYERYELRMMPDHKAKEIMDQEGLVTVSSEGLNDMAEAVLSLKCDGCQVTDHFNCKYRTALMGAGAPSFEDPVDPGCCQYKHNSEEWGN